MAHTIIVPDRPVDAAAPQLPVARRHEVDVERRRAHPGDPRSTSVSDRPSPRDDRRGAHAYADPARYR